MTYDKVTRWEKGEFKRKKPIGDQDKQVMADYLRAGLNVGKPRNDLLEELSEKYHRSTRQIERHIKCSLSEKQIYREGTVVTVAGQGKLFSIELPMRQAILHQLRVIGSRSSVFMVTVCERGSPYFDAMQSNIGMFESHGRVAMETFRIPDWYYQDKEGGTHLHLEITPRIDQYLKPQTPVEFRVGVWFTSIPQ